MEKVLRVGKWILLVWGGFSLLILLYFLGLRLYEMHDGNLNHKDDATFRDVSGILESCHVTEGQVDKILHSYRSSRSFTGDHLDGYAIKVRGLTLDSLKMDPHKESGTWYRGDQLPELVKKSIETMDMYVESELQWFPKGATLMTSDVYVLSGFGSYVGLQQYAGELTFVRVSDGMVFYINWKT